MWQQRNLRSIFCCCCYLNCIKKMFQILSISYVHGVEMVIGDPVKVPTPYGGRLVWIMPGNNKIIAHMKDKDKIRHRKRWSQVKVNLKLLI